MRFTLLLSLLLTLLSCTAAERPESPKSFAFAIFGDTPYTPDEEVLVEELINEVNALDLTWVIHVGDILRRPCSDQVIAARFRLFQRFRHPFIFTPGDNDWTDCHREGRGSYAPLERLRHLRRVFYPDPDRSTGGWPLALTSQSREAAWPEFVENARWVRDRIVFATLHVVGSDNALADFDARGEDDDREAARREEASRAWLAATFRTAREIDALGVFLVIHADPQFDMVGERLGFEAFLASLETEVESFAKPVVLAHGDSHVQKIDQPLISRTTRRPVANLTRIEVFGSPHVGWVRVVVDPAHPELFSFQPRRIGGWLD